MIGDLAEAETVLAQAAERERAAQKEREALQAQVEDGPGLLFGQLVGPGQRDAAARLVDQFDQRCHVVNRPVPGQHLLAGGRRVRRVADQGNHVVDVGDGHREADQDMGPLARLGQLELGPPGDDLFAEGDERRNDGLQVEGLGRPPFSASMFTPKLVCSGVNR